MTDEINETSATHTSSTETTEQPSESIAAQIDRMVAERTRVVVTHNGVTDGAELADDGRDLRADHNRQVSQYERLVESIDEITGYDANHQPIYKRRRWLSRWRTRKRATRRSKPSATATPRRR